MNIEPKSIHRTRLPTWVLLLAFVFCVSGVVALAIKPSKLAPSAPRLTNSKVLERADLQRRVSFYDERISPEFETFEAANREAVNRAIERTQQIFAEYRVGVKPFVEDITSLGTRFNILVRMPGNYWYEDERIQLYVQGKFESHLFSNQDLQVRLEQIILTFHDDLVSNRNALLLRTTEHMHSSSEIAFQDIDLTAFSQLATQTIVDHLAEQGVDAVEEAVVAEVLSGAAGVFAQSIATKLLASASVAIAAKLAGTGGATAVGAATGGSFGFLGGPVGSAIGAVVGLLAGVAVDMWMTDRLQDRLQDQLYGYLADLEMQIVFGSYEVVGLTEEFERVAEHMSAEHQRALRQLLIGGQE